uniref:J domain-containing protein n=1 Tax=Medicago truncatula TaxID=3880 RepID=I3SYH0_MEDTR|nr:unknown [Medicago truncatula]
METNDSEPYHSSLNTGVAMLSRRLFNSCRKFIGRQPRSDANIDAQLDRILAVVDVLEASSLRLGSTRHPDYYSILRVKQSEAANRDLIRQQFKTLVRLLDPNKNKFPFADEALMRVREAWYVLSDPVRLEKLERQIRGDDVSAASFWTMCPYCWYLHEYERKYEDCSLRCANCKRTFHGTAVNPPDSESMVEGKEQYYCYHMSLPLRYPVEGGSQFELDGKKMRIKTVVNRVRAKAFAPESESDPEFDPEEMEVEM